MVPIAWASCQHHASRGHPASTLLGSDGNDREATMLGQGRTAGREQCYQGPASHVPMAPMAPMAPVAPVASLWLCVTACAPRNARALG